jgi:divalent metal cation (Fe/Co/Zn/Cd) transporter
VRDPATGTSGPARKTGLRCQVDLHVHVDGTMTANDSHAIAGQVRAEVRHALPWVADVLVHVEPAATIGACAPPHLPG